MLQKRTISTYRNSALVLKDWIENDIKYRQSDGDFRVSKKKMNAIHKVTVNHVTLSKEHMRLIELIILNQDNWPAVVREIVAAWSGAKDMPMDIKPHEIVATPEGAEDMEPDLNDED